MASMKDPEGSPTAGVQLIQQAAYRLEDFGDVRLEHLPGQPSTGTVPDLFFTPRTGPYANRTVIVEYKATTIGRFLSSADAASIASKLSVTTKVHDLRNCILITNSEIGAGASRVLGEYRVISIPQINNADAFVNAVLDVTKVKAEPESSGSAK